MPNSVTTVFGFSLIGRCETIRKTERQRKDVSYLFKAAYSVTMNIFRKNYFLFKSFVKVELSYVFTIKMFSTAENCMEK